MSSTPSIVVPYSLYSSTCGYCSPPGKRTSEKSYWHSASADALQLSCQVYQDMIDRGWRRSGTWCYKPNLRASCCPQYTIRLDASAFKASRSQRKVISRWNRFILDQKDEDKMMIDNSTIPKSRSGKSSAESFNVISAIHAAEKAEGSAHAFEVTLEPSSYSEEKFELYQKYQMEIHLESEQTRSGFKRFLVHSPLASEPIPYTAPSNNLPASYGSYHQLYRLDGQLVAMAVLDILPGCVSSVYFMYDKNWEKFSLGKLSALREIALVQELKQAGAPNLNFLYLGFYVHSCPKMKYKGEYQPSYLADPETFEWYPLRTWTSQLDKMRYVSLSHPEHSTTTGPTDSNILKELHEYQAPVLAEDVLRNVYAASGIRNRSVSVIPLIRSEHWRVAEFRERVLCCIDCLGLEVAKRIIFALE